MADETNDTTAADEAELETDEELEPFAIDEEPELEPELALELEPEETDDGPSSQAILRALEKEERRHKKAVASALGVELEALHDCPTCQAVGYTPEPVEAPPALVRDPFTETCPRCAGNGATLSGATARALEVIPCLGCGGSGYVTMPEQPTVGAAPPPSSYSPPPPPVTPTPTPADVAAVAELRARGYTILEPIVVSSPSPA